LSFCALANCNVMTMRLDSSRDIDLKTVVLPCYGLILFITEMYSTKLGTYLVLRIHSTQNKFYYWIGPDNGSGTTFWTVTVTKVDPFGEFDLNNTRLNFKMWAPDMAKVDRNSVTNDALLTGRLPGITPDPTECRNLRRFFKQCVKDFNTLHAAKFLVAGAVVSSSVTTQETVTVVSETLGELSFQRKITVSARHLGAVTVSTNFEALSKAQLEDLKKK
jgi:hypothetical protein